MRPLLLDTHAWLWVLDDHPSLTSEARRRFLEPGQELHLSIASVWEVAIKLSLGKLRVEFPLHQLVAEETARIGVRLLEIRLEHCQRVSELPFHHRDPFDRLLVAQAQVDGLDLLSCDSVFDRYGVRRVW